MNISSLAKATGTTADTLRYYEKLGLLDVKRPGFRGGSNTGEWSHEEVPEVFP